MSFFKSASRILVWGSSLTDTSSKIAYDHYGDIFNAQISNSIVGGNDNKNIINSSSFSQRAFMGRVLQEGNLFLKEIFVEFSTYYMASTSALFSAKMAAAKTKFSENGTATNLNKAESATNATANGIKGHYGDIYNSNISNGFVGGYDNINSMYNVGFKQDHGAPVAEDENTPESSPPPATSGVDGRGANFIEPGIHEGYDYHLASLKKTVDGPELLAETKSLNREAYPVPNTSSSASVSKLQELSKAEERR
ncbi:hypothetical protein BDQ12DRAFT_668825 [Crucibulum laeve]|uniref:Uncharacterized protein n=1 Tax=Crucibulum laeve TaxID=68775 RepID=A0A5C3LQR7_9AGAR|nr:hypothetical protein BDQ12DRAFT_668825 [Crucibulum laeve]